MHGEFSQSPAGLLPGLVPGTHVAGYRLEKRVGAGGMAVVFAAVDERLRRRVALKVLAPGLAADAEFRQRFMRESRSAAAVEDAHILPVYDAGEADGVLFIAMRFVSGGDLRSILRREGAMAPARAVAVISQVASALDAAHAAGLVHRDVKPANILVDTSPQRPDQVYLSDFGLSKDALASVQLTGAGQFMGTPDYAAPEQIRGRAVDGRADQYALACVAFELLAGTAPFARAEPMAVLWAKLSEPPPSLAAVRPDLPRSADLVLGRALDKAPANRFGSCQDFADALSESLGPPRYQAPAGGLDHPSFDGVDHSRISAAPRETAEEAPSIVRVASSVVSHRMRSGLVRHWRYGRIILAVAAAIVLTAGAAAAAKLRNSATVTLVGSITAPGSRQAVLSVAFSPDGNELATASGSAAYLWSAASGVRVRTLTTPGGDSVATVAISADGNTLAVGDADFGRAYLYNRATGTRLRTLTDPGPGNSPVSVAFSPRGTLATGISGAAYLWDSATGVRVGTFDDGQPYLPQGMSVAFSPNGQMLATGDSDGDVQLWDVATGARVGTFSASAFGFVGRGPPSLAFSPDGRTLAIGTYNLRTYLWDVAKRTVIATLADPGTGVNSVAFSPDGKMLATGDFNGRTYLWDVASRTVVATVTDPGGNPSVNSVAFSPNGQMLATADTNGSTYLWKVTSGWHF